MPAKRGLFGRDQEQPVGIELRGGPGRIRTSNQFVMNLSRPQPAAETARPAFGPAKMPANCVLIVRDLGTSVGWLEGLEPPASGPREKDSNYLPAMQFGRTSLWRGQVRAFRRAPESRGLNI